MSGKLNYIKSLDGIRGMLCFVIFIAHWKLAFPIIPFGWEALQVFFVMSGFLITRILIHDRDSKPNFKEYTKSFYLKRVFRIFPLYFGYLLLFSILRFFLKGSEFIQNQTAELEHSSIWLYTYLYNFKTWFNFHAGVPFTDSPFFAHLWSLSVEEQFYMIFPFIIFLFRGRMLKGIIIAMIIIPQILRIYGYPYLAEINPDGDWAIILIYRNIVFQIDSIAMGAALAIFNFNWIKNPRFWFFTIVAGILVLYGASYPLVSHQLNDLTNLPYEIFKGNERVNWLGYLHFLGHPEILQYGKQYIYIIPLVNIACFLMILSSIKEQPIWRWFLEHPFIVHVGKISYGMYVFHYALLVVFMKFLRAILPINPIELPYVVHFLLFFVYFMIVVAVSHLSYNYFEMYFLKLKKKIN